MKFKVAQEKIASGLQLVQKAAASRPAIPILSGILVQTSPEGLTLTATDQEIGVRVSIPAMVAVDGAFVFPSRIEAIVRKIPFGEIAFEVDQANNSATISWERSRFVIQGFPASDFPALPEPSGIPPITLAQGELRRLIRQTGFAVAHDDSRPVFTGVLLGVVDANLRLVATDGFRLAVAEAPLLSHEAENKGDVIVPGRSLAEVGRIFGEESDGTVRLSLAGNHAFFETATERVVCRLIEGQFPPYKQVIPQQFVTKLICSTQGLLFACERAALIAHEVGQAIRLQISGATLVLSASKAELGSIREEVAAESQGDSLEIAFNPRYLIDGLRNITGDRMVYEFTGPLSPSCMKPDNPEEGAFTYVVLPMRLT
jgi:DNA polymerase-3 subunit beta